VLHFVMQIAMQFVMQIAGESKEKVL